MTHSTPAKTKELCSCNCGHIAGKISNLFVFQWQTGRISYPIHYILLFNFWPIRSFKDNIWSHQNPCINTVCNNNLCCVCQKAKGEKRHHPYDKNYYCLSVKLWWIYLRGGEHIHTPSLYSLKKEKITFFISSPELKAQVSFSDHLSSVLCQENFRLSSSPEPVCQFQPNLAQNILGGRGFKFFQMKGPALFQQEIITKKWKYID